MRLVGAVSRGQKAYNFGDVTGDSTLDLKISGSVPEALKSPTDVLVDYTSADAVKTNVLTAIGSGVHVVIGSSGLTDDSRAVFSGHAPGDSQS